MRPRREFDANVSQMKEAESRYLEERLQAQLKTAQLHLLHDQLTPHFMFNTLHSISTVMARDLPLARRMLVRLSDLLRRTMEAMQRIELSLREEIEILENYIELQTFRFQGRLKVRYKIESETLNCQVPSLLIQPLVENSIRHAIENANQTMGTVVVSAARERKNLVIQVRDNGPGLSGQYSQSREGVGLRNTRERLQLLYGPHQRFKLSSRRGEGLAVTIQIPAHVANTAGLKMTQSKASKSMRQSSRRSSLLHKK